MPVFPLAGHKSTTSLLKFEDAGHTGADTCQYFVGNGLTALRQLVQWAVWSEDLDVISLTDTFNICNVKHAHIHAYTAHQRSLLPTDTHAVVAG